MMIDLNNFGEMISKQEWVSEQGKVSYFTYLGKSRTYAGDNFIVVSASKRKICGYDCKVSIPEDKTQKEVEFSTANISSLANILSVADAFRSGGEETIPISVFNYNNAKEKDDNTYRVTIDEDTIFEISKERNLIADKKYFAYEENKNDPLNFIVNYEFHDYGICLTDVGESRSYLLSDEKSTFPASSEIKLSNFIENPKVTTRIPNLRDLPELIQFVGEEGKILEIQMSYDEYGLPKSGLHCLYEAYMADEFKYPFFAASMHPMYFGNFDTGILPGTNKFCVEQIDRSLDDNDDEMITYTREIYEIDDEEKINELIKLIDEAKNCNEPQIPIID